MVRSLTQGAWPTPTPFGGDARDASRFRVRRCGETEVADQPGQAIRFLAQGFAGARHFVDQRRVTTGGVVHGVHRETDIVDPLGLAPAIGRDRRHRTRHFDGAVDDAPQHFSGPPRQFGAHIDLGPAVPDHVANVARGIGAALCELTNFVGAYQWNTPDGSAMWGKWRIREVAKPERLVFINSFSDPEGGTTRHPGHPAWPLELLAIYTFEEQPGGNTKVTIRWQAHNATPEEQNTFDTNHDSMRMGWGGTLEQFVAYLAKAKME